MSSLTEEVPGAFMQALTRNNKKIRDDRALEIAEDAKLNFRRTIEDLELQLNKLRRERRSLMDLSPTDATSLVLASDFDAPKFVQTSIEVGVKMRNVIIRLEIGRQEYHHLFGEHATPESAAAGKETAATEAPQEPVEGNQD